MVEKITGTFFAEPTLGALVDAVDRASRLKWLPELIRGQAQRFDIPIFREKMEAILHDHDRS